MLMILKLENFVTLDINTSNIIRKLSINFLMKENIFSFIKK